MGWLLPGYVTFIHSRRRHAVSKHRHSSHVGHCFPSAVVSEHPCPPARHSADFWTSLGADLKFWWTVFKENYNSGQLGGGGWGGGWDEGTVETQSSFPQSSALIHSIYTACDERISALAASHSYQLIPVQVWRSGTLRAMFHQQDALPLNGDERGAGVCEERPANKLGTAPGYKVHWG